MKNYIFYCDAHGHGHDDYDDSMCYENHNHDQDRANVTSQSYQDGHDDYDDQVFVTKTTMMVVTVLPVSLIE